MTAQEINVANAILTAKEVLTQMVHQGFADAKYVYATAKMISKKYNLTQDESIIVIEESFKLV